MGEHDGAEVFDRQGKLPIFLGGFLSLALKHPAVQRYGVAVHVKQMTRTGYFTRSTNERYLQTVNLLLPHHAERESSDAARPAT